MSHFVLPDGVNLSVANDRVSVAYDGDVTLEQSFAGDVIAAGHVNVHGDAGGSLQSGADLAIAGSATGGDLRAARTVTIGGNLSCTSVHGWEVRLEGAKTITAKAISADSRVVIGKAKLKVDVIIAPEVIIDPGATGKVTIIECRNDRAKSKVKGGLSVDDYEEMMGDAGDYLNERGVSRLTGDAPPAPVVAPNPASNDADDADDLDLDDGYLTDGLEPLEEEEDVDDPVSLSVEDIELLEPEADVAEAAAAAAEEAAPDKPEAPTDPTSVALIEALDDIKALYDSSTMPPPVGDLEGQIQAADHKAIKTSLDAVWMGVLAYHQESGLPLSHRVTARFKRIQGLVKSAR